MRNVLRDFLITTAYLAESTKIKDKISNEKNKADLLEWTSEDNPWVCPFTIWDRNTAFPPLADALEITYDDRVGRHVKATRNIKAGNSHKFFL